MKNLPLTPTQEHALEMYRCLVERLGYLPSNREFQEAMGYASSSSAASMLRQLQKAGFPCFTRVKGAVQTAEDLSRAYAYWVQERSPKDRRGRDPGRSTYRAARGAAREGVGGNLGATARAGAAEVRMIGIFADQSLSELGVNDLPWIMPPPEVEEAVELIGAGDPLRQGFAWLAFWETELLFDFGQKRFWLKTGGTWSKPLSIADHKERILQQVTYARAWLAALKAQQKLKNNTKGKRTK